MRLQTVYGKIRAMLEVINPDQQFARSVMAACSYRNPIYDQTLRYSPWGTVSANIPEFLFTARMEGNTLYIPRGFNPDDLPALRQPYWDKIQWRDERREAPVDFPACRLSFSREQNLLLKDLDRVLTSAEAPFGNLLYVVPTSGGKTIFQAAAACKLGHRALVLCLTEQIKRAWLKDLEKAFGLSPRDLGLIQQQTFRIGKHFTLASVQTLARRQSRWPELFEQFGTVVLDEAHTITAPSIYRFISESPAKYLLGATATPKTRGKFNFYLYDHFGKPRKTIMAQERDTETSFSLKQVDVHYTLFKYKTEGVIDWNHLLDHLLTDEARNQMMVYQIIKDLRRKWVVLVFTKRVTHAHLLQDMLKQRGISDVNILTGDTNADRFYTEKLVEAVSNGDVRCVIATTAIKLGANIPALSSLHLATPVANTTDLEQLIGRIRRKSPGKQGCKVVYYQDLQVPYLSNLFKRIAVPVFRKLRVPEYANRYVA